MQNNRREWFDINDYVIVDSNWFLEKAYRLKKNRNYLALDALSKDGLLRITATTSQGQSLRLSNTYESKNQRIHSLWIQLAHHSLKYPIEFSSRRIDCR